MNIFRHRQAKDKDARARRHAHRAWKAARASALSQGALDDIDAAYMRFTPEDER